MRKIAPTGIAPLKARGFLIGFPGLLCLSVAASLSGEWFCAAEARNPKPRNSGTQLLPPMAADCASIRRRRHQQIKDHHQSMTGAVVVKPRLSPELRGFRSPSTGSDNLRRTWSL